MDSDSALSALALAVGLAIYMLASTLQAAIAAVRRERTQTLVSEGAAGADALEQLQSVPSDQPRALSLLRNVSFSTSLVSATLLALTALGARWVLVSAIAFGALLLLGTLHLIAQSVADRYGEGLALGASRPAQVFAAALRPVLGLIAIASRLVPFRRKISLDATLELVPTEIDLPLESPTEPLDEHEVRMIRAVVRLDQTVAREVMVPRVDIVAAELGTPIADIAETMGTRAHSRIPVYDGDLDHISGIAHARDILRLMVEDSQTSGALVDSVIRPAIFIPESKTLEELLSQFQEMRAHMAIVVDEYGGVSGLVTIEDLLEEIVGEIEDEFDVGEPDVETISDGELLLDARTSIDHLNELMETSVEGDGFDTVGGFVYHRLGKIPSPGDTLTYNGLQIEVISTLGRRLKRLRVVKTEPSEESSVAT